MNAELFINRFRTAVDSMARLLLVNIEKDPDATQDIYDRWCCCTISTSHSQMRNLEKVVFRIFGGELSCRYLRNSMPYT